MLRTYLVYNTVVRLCQFFCCGRNVNFVQIFLLKPNFLLVHRNGFSEGMDDGQKTPRGHPDFHSYVKIQRVFIWFSHYRWMESLTKEKTHLLRMGWRNLFSSCAVVSVFCSGGK